MNKISTRKSIKKNYALEFENLYDNFEREVDFVETIDKKNSLNDNNNNNNVNSLKNDYQNLRRNSIIPFGKLNSQPKKEKEIFSDEYLLDEENSLYPSNSFNNQENFDNNLIKRKSSILGILESSAIKKKNSTNSANSIGINEQ